MIVIEGRGQVYEWSGADWVQKGSDILGKFTGDICGSTVYLSGDGLTIGLSSKYNNENGIFSGQVRVFEWSGTAWIQKGGDINGDTAYRYVGDKIALSSDGDVIATSYQFGTTKYVKIYEWSGSAWSQRGGNLEHVGVNKEIDINSDGSVVCFATPLEDDGIVEVYEWSGSAWVQKGSNLTPGQTAQFGSDINLSLDGSSIIASDVTQGILRRYEYEDSDWKETNSLANYEYGYSIAGNYNNTRIATSESHCSGSIKIYGEKLILNVEEENSINDTISSLSIKHVNDNESITYSLHDNASYPDNTNFSISGNSLKAGIIFNYDTKKTYTINIRQQMRVE